MIFLYSKWVSLTLGMRSQIATVFGIAKSGSTHVQDNVVVQDGYKVADVENALSLQALRNFTGLSSDDFPILWDAMITKVEAGDLEPPMSVPMAMIQDEPVSTPILTEQVKAKRKYTKRK